MRVCEQCGNANDPQARFCVNPACGAYLGWDEPPDGTQWPAPPRDRKPAERLVEPERQEYGIRLELVPDQESTVEPGGELRLEATVRNVGTLVESLAPRVHAPVGWISVEPPTLSVFPGGQESVAVLVTPPPVPAAPAGVVPFHLVVQSTLHPRVAAAVDGTAFVGAVDQLSAELQPATATGKWRAAARLVLHNGGNRPVQVAVTADEREQAVRTAVRPALLELGPGRDAEAAVALRPRRRLWFGQPARHPYRLRVQPRPGAETGLDGAMVQLPLLPRWVPRVAFALVPLVLAAGVLGTLKGTGVIGGRPVAATTGVSTPTAGPSTAPPTQPTTPPTTQPSTPPPTTAPPTTAPPTTPPPAPVVPDVAGRQWPAAVDQLTKAGLKPTVVARRDDVVKRYQVIGTDPAAGTAFTSGDAVNVLVSTGPTPWFDFAAGAKGASWTDAGGGDAAESFDVKDTAVLPPGGRRLGPALQMDPATPDGSVTGEFTLPGPTEAGDRFRATVGLREGAGDVRVRFSAEAVAGGEPKELTDTCEVGTGEPPCTFDMPLSDVAGATQIRLRATNLGSGENAFAVWLDPRIVRP